MTIVQMVSPGFTERSEPPPPPLPPCSCARSGRAEPRRRTGAAMSERRMAVAVYSVVSEVPGTPRDEPAGSPSNRSCLELALDRERHHDGKQRGALDERRQDQRGGLDGAGDLWLAGHPPGGAAADQADPDPGADRGQAGTHAGAQKAAAQRA